jgi:hypothetical protein
LPFDGCLDCDFSAKGTRVSIEEPNPDYLADYIAFLAPAYRRRKTAAST